MHTNGYNMEGLLYDFVEGECLDVLEYLYQQGVNVDDVMSMAIRAAMPNACIIRMHKFGIPWGNSLSIAIAYNSIDIVKYMYEHGARCDNIMETVVDHGYSGILEYMHSKGEPWGNALYIACENELYEQVEYMIDHGADVDQVIKSAVSNKRPDIVKLIKRVKKRE